MGWILENKDWLFSGVGVVLLSGLIGIFIKKNRTKGLRQSIKAGDSSKNIQSGKDINITYGGKRNGE